MFVAPVPCLPAQISEGLSKTTVEQACNLIDVEKRNAGHLRLLRARVVGILQTNAVSTSSPLKRCGLCWPIPAAATHRLNPSSSGTGREEDHSVCLNLKSSWGRSTNPSIRAPGSFKEDFRKTLNRRSKQVRLQARIRCGKGRRHWRNGSSSEVWAAGREVGFASKNEHSCERPLCGRKRKSAI